VDFFTIGVTAAPEPSALPLLMLGGITAVGVSLRRRRSLVRS